MNMKIIITALVAFLAGCAQAPIAGFQMDKLRALDYRVLCRDYHSLKTQKRLTPKSQAELETVLHEKGLSKKELEFVRRGEIVVGMTLEGMYAAWGSPNHENRTVNAWGTRIQHVYEYGYKSSYVYTENGKITSYQN